ncbi:hypothetical protein NLX83_23835 [Allokutzneria sp. A3M-2-11 16]|uniref:hypothetical protein n=1 Tax=Allokutzneria sp. A3M-2-11 16 TaxID=2962043 RepID=UPI0020B73AC6|nr:hypothetical protein [Allokutzneria sp. A3M-2-11 16]MCP3802306.1 hypothetical protein [Allokutzneria sp. A3M-2-11 16]
MLSSSDTRGNPGPDASPATIGLAVTAGVLFVSLALPWLTRTGLNDGTYWVNRFITGWGVFPTAVDNSRTDATAIAVLAVPLTVLLLIALAAAAVFTGSSRVNTTTVVAGWLCAAACAGLMVLTGRDDDVDVGSGLSTAMLAAIGIALIAAKRRSTLAS